jgi:hypothetical protein
VIVGGEGVPVGEAGPEPAGLEIGLEVVVVSLERWPDMKLGEAKLLIKLFSMKGVSVIFPSDLFRRLMYLSTAAQSACSNSFQNWAISLTTCPTSQS